MAHWFADGGPSMYVILLLDVLGLGVLPLMFLLAVAARFSRPVLWPARILAMLALLGSALPAAVGALGWLYGHYQLEQALAHVSDEHREALEAAGRAFALVPLQFGLGSSLVLGFLALIPLAVAAIPARGGAED